MPDRWSAAKSKASEWGAWVEVMFGMILVAELLLPRRSVVLCQLHTCYPAASPLGCFSLSALHGRHSCFVVVQTLHLPVMLARSFFF